MAMRIRKVGPAVSSSMGLLQLAERMVLRAGRSNRWRLTQPIERTSDPPRGGKSVCFCR